jgi:hypothetical protein
MTKGMIQIAPSDPDKLHRARIEPAFLGFLGDLAQLGVSFQ